MWTQMQVGGQMWWEAMKYNMNEQADLQWHELKKSKINYLTFSGYLTQQRML